MVGSIGRVGQLIGRVGQLAPAPATGGGGWSPLDLGAALYDMWDAERAGDLTLSGSAVSAWRSAKNGYSAAQAVGAARPLYSTSSFGGRPGVTFDGSDDEMTLVGVGAFPVGAAPGEIWALMDQQALATDPTVRFPVIYGDAAATRRGIGRSVLSGVNRARVDAGNGSAGVSATNVNVDLSGRHVVRAVISGADASIRVDGDAGNTAATVPATASTRFRIGALCGASPANYFQGALSLIALTAPLSNEQAVQMLAYLKARGGIV